jgi:DNA-binding MarR family transcriptional regulator
MQAALLRVLRSLVFRDEPGVDFGEMPISQLRCLHILAEHEGQKMNDLAHRMEVKLPAASQIVDRLVKRGMVERHADPMDRRVVRLQLTPAAREMVDRLRERRELRMRATLDRLTANEVAEVVAGLDLLGRAAEQVLESERQGVSVNESGSASLQSRISRAKAEMPAS